MRCALQAYWDKHLTGHPRDVMLKMLPSLSPSLLETGDHSWWHCWHLLSAAMLFLLARRCSEQSSMANQCAAWGSIAVCEHPLGSKPFHFSLLSGLCTFFHEKREFGDYFHYLELLMDKWISDYCGNLVNKAVRTLKTLALQPSSVCLTSSCFRAWNMREGNDSYTEMPLRGKKSRRRW